MPDVIVSEKNFSADEVDLIKRTICPGSTNDELKMFLYVANKVKLDPFVRQIYSIERRSKNAKTNQWESKKQMLISIDGQRLVAERSGKYLGQVGPFWCGKDGKWLDIWTHSDLPFASKVGVWKEGFKEPTWGIAIFQSYAQYKNDGSLNTFWKKFPELMIAKCAEALALRKAFPDFLSGLYTLEEMGNEDLVDDAGPIPAEHTKEKFVDPNPRQIPEKLADHIMPVKESDPYPSFLFGKFKDKRIDEVDKEDLRSWLDFLRTKDFNFSDMRNKHFFLQVARYLGDNNFMVSTESVVPCWACGELIASSSSECGNCGRSENDREIPHDA